MPRLRTLIASLAAAAGLLGAAAPATLASGNSQLWAVRTFIDDIHETHAGATQDTQWFIPVSYKDPAKPCSYRSTITGRQEVEIDAPGQWGHYGGKHAVIKIAPNGTVSPSTFEVPSSVERHVKLVSDFEDMAPQCTSVRWGPGGAGRQQSVEMPGCGMVPGIMKLHLQFVNDRRALRVSGEFEPGSGTLDQVFSQCTLAMLPNSLNVEKEGGIIRHDYPITARHRDWWSKDGGFMEASDIARNSANDFFRKGSHAQTILAMTVHMNRH